MAVRTQIYLPEDLHNRLRSRGRILKRSMADQVREAVERYLADDDASEAVPSDPIWSLPAHAIEGPPGSPTDIATRHDAYLYRWDKKKASRSRKTGTRRSTRR
jgi:plasmid stability protein